MALFGKKALKQRVQELEEELEDMGQALEETEQTLERYKDKFRNAESEKQAAHRNRKEAEQRLQNLNQDVEKDGGNTEKNCSIEELHPVIAGLQGASFTTAHAYTAYLPEENAVLGDEDEIVFFDPFTTGVVLYPPVPVEKDVTKARTFQMEQLQRIQDGTYQYIHLSTDGSGAALIQEQTVTDHVLVSGDADIDDVVDAVDELQTEMHDRTLVSGEKEQADAFAKQVDYPVTQITSKMASVSRKDNLQRAFTTAFTVGYRRLTDEDIERVREQIF